MRRPLLVSFVVSLFLASCGGPSSSVTGSPAASTSSQSIVTVAPATTGATTSSAPTTTTETASTSAASTTTSGEDLLRIEIEGGVKTEGLDTISVRVGETVRFEVEADVADEVHVHGYDLTFEIIPGEAIVVEFVADATGIFEVELENSGIPVVDVEVTP